MDNFLGNFCLWYLPKIGGKVQKIFQTQPLNLDQISFHFVSFTIEIFNLAQMFQLPNHILLAP